MTQQPWAPTHGRVSRVLGRRLSRIDGEERATGRALYAADWKVLGMLHGKVLQSTIPHGIVTNIDYAQATSLQGVEAVITCLDTEVAWRLGDRYKKRHVLSKHARFIGEPIAAVAASSREIASKALEKINVEYDELPAVYDTLEALKPEAPKIWPEGNLSEHVVYSRGDADAGFRDADFVFEDTYRTNRHHNAPLETAVSLAWWSGDHLTVVAATQGIYRCRQQIASDLGVPINRVRVISLYKGGSFGNRNNDMNYDLIAALLAKKSGKPVMVEYSRREEFVGVHGRWGSVQHYKAGVRKNGKLTALTLRAYCDVGAYTRHPPPFPYLDGVRQYYDCPNVKVDIFPVHTNTPATGNMRAPAGLPGCFGVESFLDQAAYEIGVNPLDFRLINKTVMADCVHEYTSYGFEQCLLKGAEAFDWRKKWHPAGTNSVGGKKMRGAGMAMCTWNAHLGKGSAIVKVNSDGSVQVAVGVTDVGTGAKSAMAMIAAEEIGIRLDGVEIVWGDTDACPFSIGESGSRTTSLTGTAVRAAAQEAKTQVLKKASRFLNVSVDKLEIENGLIFDRLNTSNQVPISQVTSDPDGFAIIAEATTNVELPHDKHRLSFAAHFAELEVDTETGMVEVLSYLASHDSGLLVNKLTAESQVIGGVTMGLSLSLFEELLIDRALGTVTNPSFWTYRIIPQSSVPKIDVMFIETDDPYGPKSLGEIPLAPVAATLCNAIYNATAVRIKEMPMSPERVLTSISGSSS